MHRQEVLRLHQAQYVPQVVSAAMALSEQGKHLRKQAARLQCSCAAACVNSQGANTGKKCKCAEGQPEAGPGQAARQMAAEGVQNAGASSSLTHL